jgi:divalent metal cation (Fe/Co/Zn/Cd) transporter
MSDLVEEETEIILSETEINFILKTGKYAKVISVIGYIMMSLLFIGGVFMIYVSSYRYFDKIQLEKDGVFYIIIGGILYYPNMCLYNLSVNIKKGSLLIAFENLNNVFKFIGILSVAFLLGLLYFMIGFLLIFFNY